MRILLAGAVLAAAAISIAAAPPPRLVRLATPGPYRTACGNGDVVGLNPLGDKGTNYLSVRAAPSVQAAEIGRLGPQTDIRVCERSKDGKWLGVVYYYPNPDVFCNVDVPAGPPSAYAGPCRSGWVAARYIKIKHD